MKYDAMIIIDMQTGLIEDNPYQKDIIINNIKILIDKCRFSDIPVIHIRHDGGKGDELEKGTNGWQIYKDLIPQDHEKIIDKQFNSAFRH
ncbi:MAG: isochorismatase family protein, partial [Coprobacillus sp.]